MSTIWIYALLMVTSFRKVTFISCSDDSMQLRFVNFIFRHGIRSPLTYFKDDPNNDFWTGSIGSLTKLGKYNEYELGKWFRNRYNDFVSPYYSSEEIYIQSTDSDRCLESAQLFAAGLYPPTPNETWSNNLGQHWIPIPIHSMPIWMDPYYFDYARLFCPKYQQWLFLMQTTPQFKRLYDSHSALEELLHSHDSVDYDNFTSFANEGDTLDIEKDYNLTWPNWINESDGNTALQLTDLFTWWYTKSPEQIQLAGGVMTRELMYRMFNTITNSGGNLKVHVNAAHDYTIINILRAMEIFNFDFPEFSSAISIELYENNRQEYFIQVLYKNSTDEEPYTLQFPNCSEKCPWQFVWDLISPYFVYDFRAACRPLSSEEMKKLQVDLDELYL